MRPFRKLIVWDKGHRLTIELYRVTGTDFARFIQIALGSASELEYHLLLAADLGFVNGEVYADLRWR